MQLLVQESYKIAGGYGIVPGEWARFGSWHFGAACAMLLWEAR